MFFDEKMGRPKKTDKKRVKQRFKKIKKTGGTKENPQFGLDVPRDIVEKEKEKPIYRTCRHDEITKAIIYESGTPWYTEREEKVPAFQELPIKKKKQGFFQTGNSE